MSRHSAAAVSLIQLFTALSLSTLVNLCADINRALRVVPVCNHRTALTKLGLEPEGISSSSHFVFDAQGQISGFFGRALQPQPTTASCVSNARIENACKYQSCMVFMLLWVPAAGTGPHGHHYSEAWRWSGEE